jgi:hypothetical protein
MHRPARTVVGQKSVGQARSKSHVEPSSFTARPAGEYERLQNEENQDESAIRSVALAHLCWYRHPKHVSECMTDGSREIETTFSLIVRCELFPFVAIKCPKADWEYGRCIRMSISSFQLHVPCVLF